MVTRGAGWSGFAGIRGAKDPVDCARTAVELVERGLLSERRTEKKSTITLQNGGVKTVGERWTERKAGDDEDDVQREDVVLFIVRWGVRSRGRING